jgi:general stress protein 26
MKRATVYIIGFTLIFGVELRAQVKIDSTRQVILKAAQEIMISAGKCGLITQDEKGLPQVRTMDPFPHEADFTVWLATNPSSRKVSHIKNNPKVTLYYAGQDETGYVTLHGTAFLVNDQNEKDVRWKNEWKDFYPNRTTQYMLIKVVPDYLEVINYKRSISGDPKTWQPVRVTFNR